MRPICVGTGTHNIGVDDRAGKKIRRQQRYEREPTLKCLLHFYLSNV